LSSSSLVELSQSDALTVNEARFAFDAVRRTVFLDSQTSTLTAPDSLIFIFITLADLYCTSLSNSSVHPRTTDTLSIDPV
jgi:hypothetical protein